MNFHSIALFVEDIKKSLDFYQNVLGLSVETDMGTNIILNNGITLWQINPDNIIPQTLGRIHTRGHDFELYFEVDNIDEAASLVDIHRCNLMHPVHEEAWGQRTLRLFDPDGNLIEIGETMQTFLKRMFDSGMSLEEVSRKSFLKKEDIIRTTGFSASC